MTGLRAKVFWSIGLLLILSSLLGFLVPRIFIRKDIRRAAHSLNEIYLSYLCKIDALVSSWVEDRFIHTATQLTRTAKSDLFSGTSIRDIAKHVIERAPDIAFVQITDRESVVINLEGSQLYTPTWYTDPVGDLWIYVAEKDRFFSLQIKRDEKEEGRYVVLQEPSHPIETSRFSTLSRGERPPLPSLQLRLQQQQEKIEMIVRLEEKLEKGVGGLLYTDKTFPSGIVLLAEEVFTKQPVVRKISTSPQVVGRDKGKYLDLVQRISLPHPHKGYAIIGYSLSEIAREMAQILHKPILVFFKGDLFQGFTPTGDLLPLEEIESKNVRYKWQREVFFPQSISIGEITFTLLTPQRERNKIGSVLNQITHSLVKKISLTSLAVAGSLLSLALFLLAYITKRITAPITHLAHISEEISKGGIHEEIELPIVTNHQDEVGILTRSFHKMLSALQEREKMRGVLNKVVSKEIATQILHHAVELGGEVRLLTMLFSDIRGFTRISEHMPPQRLIQLLNAYMTRMCRVIDATQGVVDKYVGDEIMALYGAPVDLPHHAEKAVEAALLMIADLRIWNQQRGPEDPKIEVGIGIHTGETFAGNMGAVDRLNYTVIGANVNLAARLCSAADPMQILISEQTYRALPNPSKFHLKALAPILLKGIDTPVSIYTPILPPTEEGL